MSSAESYIVGATGTLASRNTCYSAGWAKYCADRFGAEIIHNAAKNKVPSGKFSRLHILYGPSNRYNLYGGPDAYKEHFEAIKDLSERACRIVTISAPIDLYNKRLPENLKINPKKCVALGTDMIHSDTADFVVGDSHALSVVFPNRAEFTAMQLTEGETLFRFIKRDTHKEDLLQFLVQCDPMNLILKFGDIDLRFNWARMHDWKEQVTSAWHYYIAKCLCPLLIRENKTINLVICLPNPVEHEERQLPNSGLKDGKPFNGTQRQRDELRSAYRSILIGDVARFVKDYSCIKNFGMLEMRDMIFTSPKDYAEKAMEKPRSVHLAPHSYYSNNPGLWRLTKL